MGNAERGKEVLEVPTAMVGLRTWRNALPEEGDERLGLPYAKQYIVNAPD